MKFSPISGVVMLAAGIILLFTMHTITLGLILAIGGAGTLIAALIIRRQRPGGYSGDGITGSG